MTRPYIIVTYGAHLPCPSFASPSLSLFRSPSAAAAAALGEAPFSLPQPPLRAWLPASSLR
eukprot:1868695-Rhodomonas_salina.1